MKTSYSDYFMGKELTEVLKNYIFILFYYFQEESTMNIRLKLVVH